MESDFRLTSEVRDNCLVINAFGYVNNEGGEKIAGAFNAHHEKGVNNLIINLQGTKVVNSIGISFLIEIIEKLNDAGGKMIFTNLDPAIEKTLTIMGLFNFAGKNSTISEALKSFE